MTEVTKGHLDSAIPGSGEAFHELARIGGARIEHIVSSDSPDDAVQVQACDEWVLLLTGTAQLELDGQPVPMAARDWLLIPAGTPHRVLRTEAGTEWLAVHGASAGEPS